jgi:large subunit ribosomal protein L10
MKREDKDLLIKELATLIGEWKHVYIADIGDLNAKDTSTLRRKCFEKDIRLVYVKNTLLRKALETYENKFDEIIPSLKGYSSIMLSNTGNAPAKLIKEFRKKMPKPILKAAYVEECVYTGDDMLDSLVNLKSRDELIGDIIAMLQSPIKNVISALESGKHTLAGVVKTLSEKEEK